MTNPDITRGLIVQYRTGLRSPLPRGGEVREVLRVNNDHAVEVAEPGTNLVRNRVAESDFWKTFELVEEKESGVDIVAAVKRESWQAGYEAGRAEVAPDGPDLAQPAALAALDSKPGVWVTSHVDPDHFATVVVDSIHEEELDAYRALDTEQTRPRVTYVEFGAPVQDVVTETHSIR